MLQLLHRVLNIESQRPGSSNTAKLLYEALTRIAVEPKRNRGLRHVATEVISEMAKRGEIYRKTTRAQDRTWCLSPPRLPNLIGGRG